LKQILKNTNISYSDTEKELLCLASWFLGNKGMWDFYIPEFAKKNRIIIDLLGWRDGMFELRANHGR
jgi:hypothetical protein